MLEKLDFMLRFWQLCARNGSIGEPLSPDERLELLSLMRLLTSDHRLPAPGSELRTEFGVPVQLTAPRGFLAGLLCCVCADGLVVVCAAPMRPGQSAVMRVADAVSGIEYTIPCVVKWSSTDGPSAMGLEVDGLPQSTVFQIPEAGMWNNPLTLSLSGKVSDPMA